MKKCLDSLNRQGFLLVIEMAGKSLPSNEFKLDACFDCVVDETRILLLRKVSNDVYRYIILNKIIQMLLSSNDWILDI